MITDGEEISDARIKFHSTKNVAKKVIVCPTKEIDNQFDCDINATFFLCFADEALQKMVQYDEYHSDHVDIQCLQHNYLGRLQNYCPKIAFALAQARGGRF
ncbi:unnamed protein product [Oikopleura dioica]|uniref:Uncharacterized protein n=1 Tax=Oikopleura dioica TaxID=34765 RepID=E4YWT0_OIKDI|nr:unnamed protein product [Oikopleura dioica]